jgi:hypothetical protein
MEIAVERAREMAEQELEPHRRPELDLIFLDDMTVEVLGLRWNDWRKRP